MNIVNEKIHLFDLLLEDTLLLIHAKKEIKMNDLVDEFGVTTLRARYLLLEAREIGAVKLNQDLNKAKWIEQNSIKDILNKIKVNH